MITDNRTESKAKPSSHYADATDALIQLHESSCKLLEHYAKILIHLLDSSEIDQPISRRDYNEFLQELVNFLGDVLETEHKVFQTIVDIRRKL